MKFIGEKNPEYALEEKDGLTKLPKEDGYRNSNGKKEGEWVQYWDNGQLWTKGKYVNGKREGEWVRYHDNGQLSSKGTYVNGKHEGEWEEYYSNGQLWSKRNYVNGKRVS